MAHRDELEQRVHEFVRRDFSPHFGEKEGVFASHPLWARMRELGTALWLDTGSLEESSALWTREMGALTTNNTLLNAEVQKGQYDRLVGESAQLLKDFNLSRAELILEIAFILNAVHGLRLVEEYDAMVSVEEHTNLAHDVEQAVRYGLRYYAICPERFIVKIPLTPSGLLATRKLSARGVPVNHTLGFSARQNVLIARVGRPAYVNVFLGRLNSYVSSNGLGSGAYVGEVATLASQKAMEALRSNGAGPRQIGASLRNGEQIRDLAGLDVLTMPPKAAAQFLALGLDPAALTGTEDADFTPGVNSDAQTNIETLWDVGDDVVACLDALDNEDLDAMSAAELTAFCAGHGAGDLVVPWTREQIETSVEEGKIPKLGNWKALLAEGRVGLDALMNLAGLNSFIGDQKAMDDRVAGLL